MLQTALFQDEWGVDNSPPDDTQIVQVILYHSRPDAGEFKRLVKLAIRDLFPDDYVERGNVSDALLLLLKKHYGQTTTSESILSATATEDDNELEILDDRERASSTLT